MFVCVLPQNDCKIQLSQNLNKLHLTNLVILDKQWFSIRQASSCRQTWLNPLTYNDAKWRARLQLIIGYRCQTALATSGKSNACHFEFFSKLLNNEDIEGFYSVKQLLCQLLDEVLDHPSRV